MLWLGAAGGTARADRKDPNCNVGELHGTFVITRTDQSWSPSAGRYACFEWITMCGRCRETGWAIHATVRVRLRGHVQI
jgi:hypothetical protein